VERANMGVFGAAPGISAVRRLIGGAMRTRTMDPLGWVCGTCAEKSTTARSFNPVSSGHSRCLMGTQRVHKRSQQITC
jgi:hypothetical protein